MASPTAMDRDAIRQHMEETIANWKKSKARGESGPWKFSLGKAKRTPSLETLKPDNVSMFVAPEFREDARLLATIHESFQKAQKAHQAPEQPGVQPPFTTPPVELDSAITTALEFLLASPSMKRAVPASISPPAPAAVAAVGLRGIAERSKKFRNRTPLDMKRGAPSAPRAPKGAAMSPSRQASEHVLSPARGSGLAALRRGAKAKPSRAVAETRSATNPISPAALPSGPRLSVWYRKAVVADKRKEHAAARAAERRRLIWTIASKSEAGDDVAVKQLCEAGGISYGPPASAGDSAHVRSTGASIRRGADRYRSRSLPTKRRSASPQASRIASPIITRPSTAKPLSRAASVPKSAASPKNTRPSTAKPLSRAASVPNSAASPNPRSHLRTCSACGKFTTNTAIKQQRSRSEPRTAANTAVLNTSSHFTCVACGQHTTKFQRPPSAPRPPRKFLKLTEEERAKVTKRLSRGGSVASEVSRTKTVAKPPKAPLRDKLKDLVVKPAPSVSSALRRPKTADAAKSLPPNPFDDGAQERPATSSSRRPPSAASAHPLSPTQHSVLDLRARSRPIVKSADALRDLHNRSRRECRCSSELQDQHWQVFEVADYESVKEIAKRTSDRLNAVNKLKERAYRLAVRTNTL